MKELALADDLAHCILDFKSIVKCIPKTCSFVVA